MPVHTKRQILSVLIAIFASLTFTYRLRATLPIPMSYVHRLEYLNGYAGFDCTTFLCVAHGTTTDYPKGEDFYRSTVSRFFKVVAVFPDVAHIDESKLQPGDVAAFLGNDGRGRHVVAFLRSGLWTDSDYRRGTVAEFSMQTKNTSDDWFTGKVRILRWK